MMKYQLHRLILSEIKYRKTNFILSVLSVFIASSALTGAVMMLETHDFHTHQMLQEKEKALKQRMSVLNDNTRKAMLELGFNLVILPEEQNLNDWYANDYGTTYMPEDYVDDLAGSGILIVRHFLPILQQKIIWPEQNKTIILVGTRGEVPNIHKTSREPMIDPVKPGTIKLGYELQQSLNIKEGDHIRLLDQTFRVSECYQERGDKDDITAWIHLDKAQELLKKEGKVNAILALECLCKGEIDLDGLRQKITEILPGTRVIERDRNAYVRENTRLSIKEESETSLQEEKASREELREIREDFASALTPLIFIACGIWITFLGLMNSRTRKGEIGILRAMGVPVFRITRIFFQKYIITGITGGLLGFLGGIFSSYLLSKALEGQYIWIGALNVNLWGLLAVSIIGSTLLVILSGWLPALSAASQDPAKVLHNE